uniref:(California timema) hypothetical protein n=1 Tax=Timema californicum TaxID=61474 RepID=A0A7R9PBR3_TIMCA|nr:unnamed protein product [Timema californicum]
MGSMIRAETFPEEKRRAFLEAFSELPQRVLWKWEGGELPDQPSNVLTQKWMPQFDILCHPNVRVFISHGGQLSTIESVHCGVPMIVIPVYGDQPVNAGAVAAAGMALRLDYHTLTKKRLLERLHAVLNNTERPCRCPAWRGGGSDDHGSHGVPNSCLIDRPTNGLHDWLVNGYSWGHYVEGRGKFVSVPTAYTDAVAYPIFHPSCVPSVTTIVSPVVSSVASNSFVPLTLYCQPEWGYRAQCWALRWRWGPCRLSRLTLVTPLILAIVTGLERGESLLLSRGLLGRSGPPSPTKVTLPPSCKQGGKDHIMTTSSIVSTGGGVQIAASDGSVLPGTCDLSRTLLLKKNFRLALHPHRGTLRVHPPLIQRWLVVPPRLSSVRPRILPPPIRKTTFQRVIPTVNEVYTYPTEEEWDGRMVLRGLPLEMPVEDIAEALSRRGYQIWGVTQLSVKEPRAYVPSIFGNVGPNSSRAEDRLLRPPPTTHGAICSLTHWSSRPSAAPSLRPGFVSGASFCQSYSRIHTCHPSHTVIICHFSSQTLRLWWFDSWGERTRSLLCGSYVPPGLPLLWADLSKIRRLGASLVLSGDFNAHHEKWDFRFTDVRGVVVTRRLRNGEWGFSLGTWRSFPQRTVPSGGTSVACDNEEFPCRCFDSEGHCSLPSSPSLPPIPTDPQIDVFLVTPVELHEVPFIFVLPQVLVLTEARHSSTHALAWVVDQITDGFSKSVHTGLVVLDVQSAFDSVSHSDLLLKLLSIILPITNLFQSFLLGLTFQVCLNAVLSSSRPILASAQESLLYPLLYSWFVHIPLPLSCSLPLYADDTALMAQSIDVRVLLGKVSCALRSLSLYFALWGLLLNLAKIQAIIFTRHHPGLFLPLFRESAKQVSRAFQDRPMLPMDTAIYWTEYVVRHRGAPLLHFAGADLSLHQYLLLDVVAVLAVFAIIVNLIVFVVVKKLVFLYQTVRAEWGGGGAAPVETARACVDVVTPHQSSQLPRQACKCLRRKLYLRIWCKEKRLQ